MRRLPLLVLSILSTSAHAAQSTFDVDNEGWRTCNVNWLQSPTTVGSFEAAPYSASGGNPGGALTLTDTDPGWGFFVAPSSFLGDQSSAFGTSFTYDASTTQSDGLAYPAVVLRSGSTFLYSLAAPPASAWSHVAVPLVGSSWSLSPTGGSTMSDAGLRGFLADLDGLYIDADWTSGTGETAGLDNVVLNANPVPEPSCVVALGVGALAFLRRRR